MEPKLETPPTSMKNQNFSDSSKLVNAKRLLSLKDKLRLSHIIEGTDETSKIVCFNMIR
jgi:hypothetical protein